MKKKSIYNTKLNKVLLAIIGLGILIIVASLVAAIFFGSWTDARFNPEDGGVGLFIVFYGIPLIIIGAIPLLSSLFLAHRGGKMSDKWGLLKFVALTIALFIAIFGLLTLWSEYDNNNFEQELEGTTLDIDEPDTQ